VALVVLSFFRNEAAAVALADTVRAPAVPRSRARAYHALRPAAMLCRPRVCGRGAACAAECSSQWGSQSRCCLDLGAIQCP